LANQRGPTITKRQKERAREEKQQAKAEKRAQRKAERVERPSDGVIDDPDLAGMTPGPQPPLDDDF
jgi:hypothetical protein